MSDLKVGDVARLRGGGPALTVTALVGDVAHVTWFSGEDLRCAELPLAALQVDAPVVAPLAHASDDSIGVYIDRTYGDLEISGDTEALEWPFTKVHQARGRKGPFVQFVTDLGRVGFWPNAAHGPLVRIEKKGQ